MDAQWQALAREAAVAAEHLCIGVTALGRANYAQTAYFGQALFALSVGIERSCKLALASDYALNHSGTFPEAKTLRSYGHNLAALLESVELAAAKYPNVKPMQNSPVHDSVVSITTSFASNVTRYYNLESLAKPPSALEPAAEWYERITVPILQKHVSKASITRAEVNAATVGALLSGAAAVRFTHESGKLLGDPASASLSTGLTRLARPWERMYVLRIARHLGSVLSAISNESYSAGIALPHYGDFFGPFNNSDSYFRGRKTWSIYPS